MSSNTPHWTHTAGCHQCHGLVWVHGCNLAHQLNACGPTTNDNDAIARLNSAGEAIALAADLQKKKKKPRHNYEKQAKTKCNKKTQETICFVRITRGHELRIFRHI
jgi:hypothetical protein